MQIVRSKSKIKAVHFCPKKSKKELAQLALALSNNSVEVNLPPALLNASPVGAQAWHGTRLRKAMQNQGRMQGPEV